MGRESYSAGEHYGARDGIILHGSSPIKRPGDLKAAQPIAVEVDLVLVAAALMLARVGTSLLAMVTGPFVGVVETRVTGRRAVGADRRSGRALAS